MEFLNALFTAAFDNNIVFAQLIAMVSVILVAQRPQDAIRMGGLLGISVAVAGIICWPLYAGFLLPWGVSYLAPLGCVLASTGAIFVGAWSSEPLGDYVAGPNHTLPTGGTAMFSNPLSVEEFVKRSSVICYTPEGLLSDAPATQRLAEAEGLWAHALSAALRRRVLEQGEDSVSAESLAAADLTKVAWPGDAVATVAEGVDLAATSADGAGATGKEA